MFDKKEDSTELEMEHVVRLASGLLAGAGTSHNDTKGISELAVKHAYAIRAEIKRAAESEKARIEFEERQADLEKEKAKKAEKEAEEAAESEKEKSKHAHKK